ncbi:MAG: DUF5675 family protein [Nitrosotalea sp.]
MKQGDSGTFGQLILPDGTILYAGECPWRDNKEGISCVPDSANSEGYLVKLTKTTKHPDGIFMLQNVLNRFACEIHIGNFCGAIDLGYQSDVEGCIILGQKLGQTMTTKLVNNKLQDAVLESTSAFNNFMKHMNGEDFYLKITYL